MRRRPFESSVAGRKNRGEKKENLEEINDTSTRRRREGGRRWWRGGGHSRIRPLN